MTHAILHQIQRSETPNAVRETLFAYFGEKGFDRIGFGAPSRCEPGALTIVERGYPAAMIGRYHAGRMHHHDPYLNQARATARPVRWREVVRQAGLNATERMVSGGQLDKETTDGFTIPTYGRANSTGVVNIGTTTRSSAIDSADLPLYHAVAQQAHLRIDQIERDREPRAGLSPREREILFWIAQNKSNTDIGTILSVSPETVATHIKRIFCKLAANDRMTAVNRGVETGQVWR